MNQETTRAVRLEIRDHVAFLTFTRPEAANTINLEFGREFRAAVGDIAAANAVRAVVMTGEGKNFCFGGDLRAMAASGTDVQSALLALTTDLHAGVAQLTTLNAAVIAAINGTAAGAGLGLALCADYSMAGRSSKFAPAYTGVALTPDAGCSYFLPRAIGYKRALDMLMTNRVLDAQTALEWGMINEVVDDDKLLEAAHAWAARLAKGPAGAYGALKRLLAESQPGLVEQLAREGRSIAARAATPEGGEGILAFLEKRGPRYF